MVSYLVMLQTNSNQPFIFSSPRLREQIGASLSRIYGPVDVLPCPQGFVMVRA